jgi:hypothetical protein
MGEVAVSQSRSIVKETQGALRASVLELLRGV